MIGKERVIARLPLGLSVLGVLAVAVSASVPLPHSVTARGIVFPSARWALTKTSDGQLVGSLFSYKKGLSEGFNVTHFARGEAVRVDLHPGVVAFGWVGMGDTVASVHSTEAEERLAELTGELAVARAALASGSTGEKQPQVEALEYRLERATAPASHQHRELDRVPEEIQLHRSTVNALSRQIEVLEDRLSAFTITSPLEGIVSRGTSPDTLLAVSDVRSLVLFIPVRWADYEYASGAKQVTVELGGSNQRTRAELISFQPEVRLFGGEPAVMATALVTYAPDGLMPGMVTECVIHCEPITILERLRRVVPGVLTQ